MGQSFWHIENIGVADIRIIRVLIVGDSPIIGEGAGKLNCELHVADLFFPIGGKSNFGYEWHSTSQSGVQAAGDAWQIKAMMPM
uniref:Uncharacterized protein n=1 Tax=Romanomermis culicivorax TaxID=13658 RepID=A0A915KAB3_ROMCU